MTPRDMEKTLRMSEQMTDGTPAAAALQKKPVVWLHWSADALIGRNWGDKLNPALVRFLSGRKVRHGNELPADRGDRTVYSVIGSHIARSEAHWTVWGTGFISLDQKMRAAPKQICAVRGPLTQRKLTGMGIACPQVYGDAALLYPAMHAAPRAIKYDLGIIQHIREAGEIPLPPMDDAVSVKVIDITGGLTEVIDEIVSCRRIVSSSLHGQIAAHAYGVPASWVSFSDRPKGDGFKFRDYWATAGNAEVQPTPVTAATTMRDLAALRTPVTEVLDLDALIDCCPFMDDDRKHKVSRLVRKNFRMHDLLGA